MEEECKAALKAHLSHAITDPKAKYLESEAMEDDTMNWIDNVPAQILVLACQVLWTRMVEATISSPKKLLSVENHISKFIEMLALVVVKNIDLITRRKAEGLITELVHQRDIIRMLISGSRSLTVKRGIRLRKLM